MMDVVSQLWVTIFGVTALWMAQSRQERWRAAAVLFGLLGQPGWYFQLVIHGQWFMLPAFVAYTACWVRGFWIHWMAPGLDAMMATLALADEFER